MEVVSASEDRHGEGHFCGRAADTLTSLRAAGLAMVLTDGRWQLYRRFGTAIASHHTQRADLPVSFRAALRSAQNRPPDSWLYQGQVARHIATLDTWLWWPPVGHTGLDGFLANQQV